MNTTRAIRVLVTTSVCAGGLIVASASTALAGEITGNGTYKDVNGRSICAYSGQNDAFHDPTHSEGPGDTGRVQSYGQIIRYTGSLGGIPGTACNPTRGFSE